MNNPPETISGEDLKGLIFMRAINTGVFKPRSLAAALLLAAFSFAFLGSGAARVFAHGGEDHGDEKPKTATTTTGTISRTARLGDFEIMLKHPLLEPDAATSGRLFITNFTTNEPVGAANPTLEIESANGAVTEIPVEKTEQSGSYVVKIPALTEGSYTLRAKATVGGKSDTATFSGVEVTHQEAAAAESGGSWLQTSLTGLLFLVAFALFVALVYFAVRVVKNKPLREETVSA